MRRGQAWRLIGILAIAAGSAAAVGLLPFRLGLDLQGGIHAVLEAQPTEETEVTREVMDQVRAIVERRVNGLGVAEPVIQSQGERRLIVELPGIQDAQEALQAIGKTAQLEIRDPNGNTVITGADLADARLSRDQFGRPAVAVTFTPEGARKFARLTTVYQGMQIPHVLDDEVLVSPVVQEPILNGQGIITGRFTIEEASQLAVLLRSGALPVPLEVLEVRNVGPTLGQESIDRSVKAGILAAVLTVLFMVAIYRLPGAVACVALGIYALVVLAVFVVLGATLTLPGIAGFILSVGMAVDANIVIYERVRDELRNGKSLRAAIGGGWSRALAAILDSNLTTLVAAAILFYLGTGPVRGFAVTLTIGLFVSMFTAIIVTRILLEAALERSPNRTGAVFGVREAAR
ncbi:MAG TPA: protein translocase subunit SecD [Limnochordia bacterium]